MSFIRTIVGRPVSILMLFVAMMTAGVLLINSTPVALYPDINSPVLMVSTSYDGGPEQVEEYVTRPLEAAVAGLSGIESLSSTSSRGSSRIILTFGFGVDLTEAKNDLRDILERVSGQLPDGADVPQIFRFDPNSRPIITIALSGNLSVEQLRRIAEDDVQPSLARVRGVARAEVQGGRTEILLVEPDATALAVHGLSMSSLASAISSSGSEVAAGSIEADNIIILLSSDGRFTSLDDLGLTVVGRAESGRPVFLHEVAHLAFEYDEASSYVTMNGMPAVTIAITSESDANTVAVSNGVSNAVAQLSGRLPSDVRLSITNDNSVVIRDTLEEVGNSLLIGALLAVLVLLLFLHNLRASIIIAVSIPVSLMATLLAMRALGITLNLLSMSGLVLGIGMIVDSSIVVIENIERQLTGGLELREATVLGTAEMITPITASALTTISVFAPLLLFRNQLGILGILFGDISYVIIAAIVSSWAVAALLIPVLASAYIRLRSESTTKSGPLVRLGKLIGRNQAWVERVYERSLRVALRSRVLVLSSVVALLIVSGAMLLGSGFSFAPMGASDTVTVNLEFRQGTSLEDSHRVAEDFGAWVIQEVPEAEAVVVTSNQGSASVVLTLPALSERTRTQQDISAIVRRGANSWPEIRLRVLQFGSGRGGGQSLGGNPVEIKIQGDDMLELIRVASDTRELIERSFPEVTDVAVDLGDGSSRLTVRPRRDQAAQLGVGVSTIGSELRAAFNGVSAGRYTQDGVDWTITVRLSEEQRADRVSIESLPVLSANGTALPLSAVAEVHLGQSPTEIRREEQRRTIRITGGLAEGAPSSLEMSGQIEDAIYEQLNVPGSVEISFGGEAEEIVETGRTMLLVLILAVLLVFAVMAGQFESFKMPFVIFFTIPLMLVGVMLIHRIMGQSISMFSLVGLVVLVGIVVNNGIVLVDYTNLLRGRGYPVLDAACVAARTRLRPIIMTSLTTMLGMVPLAFFAGEGASITQPVGLTVVGGLASSTLMTLYVIPVLYTLIAGTSDARKADPIEVA